MNQQTLSVKYVLYSHYAASEIKDYKSYSKDNNPVESLDGIRHLEDHFKGLKELLNAPGHEGLLVLFYSSGFEEFIEGIKKGLDEQEILAEYDRLKFADEIAKCIRKKLSEADLKNRVRIVTPLDLFVMLGRVKGVFKHKFQTYFVGMEKGIRYDTPKIVEAIIRLRLLGNGVPVLRLDHDVIFRGSNKGIGDLGLFKAVACSQRAYEQRLEKPTVSTFLFSSSYNTRSLADPSYKYLVSDNFEAWSRAFATRIHPALLVNPDKIKEAYDLKNKQRDIWDEYVENALDESIARQYYGLKADGLEADQCKGLTEIGAHPLYAVISGSLLCLSEGAILDLPPFSNFRSNVMWIDDHLKYSLHRSMHHFSSGETISIEPGLNYARLDDVMVTKARPSVKDLPRYTVSVYLPTLLYGTIMDSWINRDPILKRRFKTLNDQNLETRWQKAHKNQTKAVLPQAMSDALISHNFEADAQWKLEKRLEKKAIERIELVRQQWAKLSNSEMDTFASSWAKGTVSNWLPKECIKQLREKEDELPWEGIVTGRPLDEPISKMTEINPVLARKIDDLIRDAITYIEWTLDWPEFVQIVRSVRQGSFCGDLSWSSED